MYNIYTENKKKKELENKQKEELRQLKYKEKFQSKKHNLIQAFNKYRTNYNNV